jgi:[ribosomal protein S5]-alanine N-acetyltransferase
MDYFSQLSERLQFRALTENDINSWLEFFEGNNRLAFLGIDVNKDYLTLATEWISKQLERYQTDGFGHLAVIEKSSGDFIGMGGILVRELDGEKVFEIAYSLKPTYWNQGFGTEIAQKLKQFGLENQIATNFVSIIHKENEASMHVARKNGMKILRETNFMGMEVFVFGLF